MWWIALVFIGLSVATFGVLILNANTLKAKKTNSSFNVVQLREKSKHWFSGARWTDLQTWFRMAGLRITLGEIVLIAIFVMLAIEVFLVILSSVVHKAFLLVALAIPLLILWIGIYAIQEKGEKRRRVLLTDFIHCFSRLSDFVHYSEITDYEKIRRSMIGTRILHQALDEPEYFRKNPRESLSRMEKWIAFEEEGLILRFALQEALYSQPDDAERNLLEMVKNLSARKATRWKKELRKIEFFALLSPRVGVGVCAVLLIVPMTMVIRKMMGW